MDSRCLGSNKRVRRPVNRLLCFFTLLSFGCGDIELPQVDLPGIPKKEAPVVQDQPSTETPTPSTSPTAPAMTPAPTKTPEQIIAELLARPSMNLTDADLTTLSELPAARDTITELNLSASTISGTGLKALQDFPGLTKLNLQAFTLSDGDWSPLGNLKSLKELNLSRSGISNLTMTSLSPLKQLTVLDLSETSVTDEGLAALKEFSSLEQLRIGGTQMSGAGLEFLGTKGARAPLKVLSASNTSLGYQGFVHINQFPTLEELHVAGSSVTNSSMTGLKGLNNLRIVQLSGNLVSDEGLKSLTASRTLEELTLAENRPISDACVVRLKTFRQLKYVDLDGTSCTLKGVEALKKALPECKVRLDQQVY